MAALSGGSIGLFYWALSIRRPNWGFLLLLLLHSGLYPATARGLSNSAAKCVYNHVTVRVKPQCARSGVMAGYGRGHDQGGHDQGGGTNG